MPFMLDAQKIIQKVGFEYICSPMGAQATRVAYLDAEEFMILLRLDCST
jgi:hypothetical protein